MIKNLNALKREYFTDESGATAIEYGLIAAGIAVVIIGGIALVGPKLKTIFATIGGSL
ncbi:MAG: Flp family type IVb pilin [Alphaproteobacteria bacterium]|nr:Flp family type IVb pilin [Alphaproteobacteria bacterium]